jgi:hypothetical protein
MVAECGGITDCARVYARSTLSRKIFCLILDFITVLYSYWPGKIGVSHRCVDENTTIGHRAAWNIGTTVSE